MTRSKFQTIVDIPAFRWKTGYKHQNLFMGSCFAENIGNKLTDLKYPVDSNPFGILYNPMSVAMGLEHLINQKIFDKNDLVKHNGLWHSFSHHGRFSAADADECLTKINNRIKSSSETLKNDGFLFLTFGTAWIYKFNKSGKLVANCHKIPAKKFSRERLSLNEIVEKYKALLNRLWLLNPNLKIVFTVSPIRHWKDGAIENQRSKATLLLAVEELVRSFGKDKCAYFPSYEIVMDELRDYRFYAEDMLHLSDVAVNHIWEAFEDALIDEHSKQVSNEVLKIRNAVKHRPINKNSKEYHKFLLQFFNKIIELETKLPYLNFQLEKEHFKVEMDAINSQK